MLKIQSSVYFVVFVLLLASCQKEVNEKLPDPPIPTVSSDDPLELSSALRIWHGTRVQGSMPSPNSSVPSLDETINLSVEAFAGRYAIIKPTVLDGEIEGYYLTVNGSNQYFNVDFTKPRDIAGRKNNSKNSVSRLLSPQGGNSDSSIVIVLPPNIQVPDTFCVTYSPYDANGNVGPAVTTCIYINSLGGDTQSEWLHNNWRITSFWLIDNNQFLEHDTIIYNKWDVFFETNGYICEIDPNFGPLFRRINIASGLTPIVADTNYFRNLDFRFAENGASDYLHSYSSKYFIPIGVCTNRNFDEYDETIFTTGAWNFNSTNNNLLLIYDFDDNGVPDPSVYEFTVTEKSENYFVASDGSVFYRFEKF